jgi:hypothetical protein
MGLLCNRCDIAFAAPDSLETEILSAGLQGSRHELVQLEERHSSQADLVANTMSATIAQIQAHSSHSM